MICVGLCAKRRLDTGRPMGLERIKGPRRAILGSPLWQCPAHAPRAQELWSVLTCPSPGIPSFMSLDVMFV